LALVLGFATAAAQGGKPARIRATVEKVDGNTLTVKDRKSAEMKVVTADKLRVQGFAKASLADISVDSYIGVTGMPEPDGTQKAIAIHIFAPAQRGVGEGFRPWDLRPNSTMTNAAVSSKIAGNNGNVLTMKYKGGEQKVVVTPDTAIVKVVPANKSEIKPGAHIIIMRANPQPDGSYKTGAIYVGLNGITPPM
jgi:hypothetical protein